MELSSSWEVISCADIQWFPNIFLNPISQYSAHKHPPLVSSMSQINLVHTNSKSLRSILLLSTNLHLSCSGLFPSGFLTNILHVFLFSPICGTFPAHLITLDFIILIISSKGCSSEAPNYAVFSNLPLHPPLVKIFSSAPYSQTLSVYVPLIMSVTKFHTNTEPVEKLFFCI
jgi:hypothetical protein